MESLPKETPPSCLTDDSPLDTSAEIRRKAKEERQRQLQCLLEGKPIEEPTQESIEEEVNRLMEEVELHEKNYIPKDIEHSINEEDENLDFLEDDENDKNLSEKKNNNIINTNSKKDIKKNEIKKNETKKKPDLDLDIKDLEDIIEENYFDDDNNNKNNNSQKEDKELKELLNLYEKQLDKDIKEEVELQYKPSVDPNDVKRADILLQKDKLLNTAVIQGIISKEELIMYVDYYEIFSLMNKSKKFTQQHLQAIEDLCIKNNENKNNNNEDDESDENEKKDVVYDNLNHEDAINKLTDEIEKKLESSEDILNKKMEFLTTVDTRNKDNLKDIIEKYKNRDNDNKSERNIESAKSDISNITNKTGFTNYTNLSINNKKTGGKFDPKKINLPENNNDINTNTIKNDDKLPVENSSMSEFTTEELMSVPKYITIKKEPQKQKSDKKQETEINIKTKTNILNNSSISSISKKTNNTNNNINNNKNNTNILFPPKTPLPKKNILKNSNNDNNNTIMSLPTGKKTIAPISQKSCRLSTMNNIKSNPKVNLFDDNANPINVSKLRGARKELVKLKMGNKSKMHELFSEKPRNLEENEILKQKFMDFILSGKENNKNPEMNALKKSIVRKKIEDAQNFNKNK